MTTKLCRKCGETKTLDEFSRNCRKRDGLESSCKGCVKAKSAAHYAANRDKAKARSGNPDTMKARAAAYRAGGRDSDRPWPGGPVGYRSAHLRVQSVYGLAKNHQCKHCDGPATEWAYNYGDPDECSESRFDARSGSVRIMRWSGKPQHYMTLCKSCHTKHDKKESAA